MCESPPPLSARVLQNNQVLGITKIHNYSKVKLVNTRLSTIQSTKTCNLMNKQVCACTHKKETMLHMDIKTNMYEAFKDGHYKFTTEKCI